MFDEKDYEECLKMRSKNKLETLRKVKRNETGDLTWAVAKSKWLCRGKS